MSDKQEDNTNISSEKEGGYFDFSEVLRYLFKGSRNKNASFNIKAMHTINRVAILMFLVAVIVIISRAVLRAM